MHAVQRKSIPVDLLLQHGGTGGVRGDNAVLQGFALQHGQIQEGKLAGPHAHQGLDRGHHQPLHPQPHQNVLHHLHQQHCS